MNQKDKEVSSKVRGIWWRSRQKSSKAMVESAHGLMSKSLAIGLGRRMGEGRKNQQREPGWGILDRSWRGTLLTMNDHS